MVLTNILIVLNLFFAVSVFAENIYYYSRVKEDSGWSKILYAFIGLMWMIRWVLYFMEFPAFSTLLPGPLSMTTLTLLAMTVGANIRLMRDVGKETIKKDFRKWILRQS